MGFADSVRKTASKQLEQVDKRIESMAVELFTAAVDLSPAQPAAQYAKGQFINNWRAVVNGDTSDTTKSLSMTGEASRESISQIKGSKTFLGKDAFVTLTNNLPYAGLVEYVGWPQSINPRWINKVGPYAPVRNAFTKVMPKYKVKQ